MLIPMDPQLIRQLLENEEDTLTAAAKAEDLVYKHTQCPVCGQSGCEKRYQAPKIVIDENGAPTVLRSPFGSGPLPEGYAHCIHCSTDFNPYTGLIFKTDASMIREPR